MPDLDKADDRIDTECKSLTLWLEFRAGGQTFTDLEVTAQRDEIMPSIKACGEGDTSKALDFSVKTGIIFITTKQLFDSLPPAGYRRVPSNQLLAVA